MRCAAFVLLCSCAAGPSSIPYVRIDRSLTGPVMSREAAEAIDAYRTRERAGYAKELVDEREKRKRAEAIERDAKWWRENWPWVVFGGVAAGFAVGFGAGISARAVP